MMTSPLEPLFKVALYILLSFAATIILISLATIVLRWLLDSMKHYTVKNINLEIKNINHEYVLTREVLPGQSNLKNFLLSIPLGTLYQNQYYLMERLISTRKDRFFATLAMYSSTMPGTAS